jgi:hypothetical protein
MTRFAFLSNRSLVAIAFLALTLVGAAPAAAQSSRPTSQPTGATAAAAGASARGDAEALALARRVYETAGGDAAYHANGVLMFDFVVINGNQEVSRRSHAWNPTERSAIVRIGPSESPAQMVYLPDVSTTEGAVTWRAGEMITEPAMRDTLAQSARAMFINDGYWLLAPLKVLDPGVTLAMEAPREFEEREVAVLRLTFDSVGLTPTDRYLLYIDQETAMVVGWNYKPAAGEGRDFEWRQPATVGPFTLPMVKPVAGGARTIAFDAVAFEEGVSLAPPAEVLEAAASPAAR